jgi:FkbM family methyltransferase
MRVTTFKPFLTLRALRAEWRGTLRLCGSFSSRLRLMSDFFFSHILFALPPAMLNRQRQIITRSGVRLTYRLNRGDLQGIREVWFDEVYRLPFPTPPGPFLDLGANIGLTTVWMAKHDAFTKIIAVEPDHANALLAAKNLEDNQIHGTLIEAAVGPSDGFARFAKSGWSNLGHVADEGEPVRLMSVSSILQENGLDHLGLVKVDIEGGEQALFLGASGWLRQTQALVVEFHPSVVDYPLLTSTVASRGFEYIPASSQNMDCFRRIPAPQDRTAIP